MVVELWPTLLNVGSMFVSVVLVVVVGVGNPNDVPNYPNDDDGIVVNYWKSDAENALPLLLLNTPLLLLLLLLWLSVFANVSLFTYIARIPLTLPLLLLLLLLLLVLVLLTGSAGAMGMLVLGSILNVLNG